ncbi:GNAT family N-acetyltransferase [Streptomyces sp. B1866]|uniref:GNAT family N-acetyltransferase n=1 Tax=Streptomyces sp. B1866 TaxID=3075431 RepID=UPI00288F5064|nr:GNAT family N-acetyltransferase [Streptomyces sp. B1866]MDT3396313.1 GNAT family N-acetyltransferase [Streptomyces sp. B1866]
MYEMRPAVDRDHEAITGLIAARNRWFEDRGIVPNVADGSLAATLIGDRAEDGRRPLAWVLCEDGQVLGCTVLLSDIQAWGWTDQQRAEPSLLMLGTYTDPAHRHDKPGRLMAWWSVDYAARLGGVRWVRRVTFADRLMRYYRDQQKWNLVDTVIRDGRHAYLMQRRAERLKNFESLVADSGSLTASAS